MKSLSDKAQVYSILQPYDTHKTIYAANVYRKFIWWNLILNTVYIFVDSFSIDLVEWESQPAQLSHTFQNELL